MLHNEATTTQGVTTVYWIKKYAAKALLNGDAASYKEIPKEIKKDVFKLLEFKMKENIHYPNHRGLSLLNECTPLYSTYEAVKASVKEDSHLIVELELPEDSIKINADNTCTVISDFPLELVNLTKLYFHPSMWKESTRGMPKRDDYVWLENPALLRSAEDSIFNFAEVYSQSKHSSPEAEVYSQSKHSSPENDTLNLLPPELQEYISLFIGAKLDRTHVNKIMEKAFNAVNTTYQSRKKLESLEAILGSNYFSNLNKVEDACIRNIKQILEDESPRKLIRIVEAAKAALTVDDKKSAPTSGITSYIPTWKKPIVLNQKVKNFLVAIDTNDINYLTSKVAAIRISNSL